VAVIGGFRSDLSIPRKTDLNFGNVSAGVLIIAFRGRVSMKTVVIKFPWQMLFIFPLVQTLKLSAFLLRKSRK